MDTIIKAVIIDDELHARESLKMQLQEKHSQVQVCGIANHFYQWNYWNVAASDK